MSLSRSKLIRREALSYFPCSSIKSRKAWTSSVTGLSLWQSTNNEKLKSRILHRLHVTDPRKKICFVGLTMKQFEVQFICYVLPFGGVGRSGFGRYIGRYHGKYTLGTFSHQKAVLHRRFILELEPGYPPWNSFKLECIRLAYRFDYLNMLLLLLGLRRNFTATLS